MMMHNKINVLVIGASDKEHRYSNKAIRRLLANNYEVICMHPKIKEIEGLPVYNSFEDMKEQIHTITLYVAQEKSMGMIEEILKIKPKRIIFNPGTENEILQQKAKMEGIEVLNACTIVLLSTGQF
jgi:predicted CoA-binding protein